MADSISYFQKRMNALGVNENNNKIGIWENVNIDNQHTNQLVYRPIFKEIPEGIDIFVYTIDREAITVKKDGSRWKKAFSIIRLEKPIVRPDGSTMKYKLPKGAGTFPFFPPSLVEKFEKKEAIHTLFITEGFFKAFKGSISGLDIVGLSSITHMKDSETGKMHGDILRLLINCNVQRVVWLTDGDALDVTNKELTEASDLSKRPKNFFSTVLTFKALLDDFDNLEKWFFHIDTDSILTYNPNIPREDVKGLDDLLITLSNKQDDILNDIRTVAPGNYFQKFNITYSTNKVYNHFHLRDVKDFYLFHVERRPELKNSEFIFNGTRYLYNEETGDCDVKVPSEAKIYFRVADDYYKFVRIPNQYDQLERIIQARQKTTIKDDHGPTFLKHIPKYEAFCNVPSHTNFQPIIHNCFNVYSPLDYFPDDDACGPDDCPAIMGFIHHIFGDRTVSFTDPITKEKKSYTSLELGLDYLQIQYQNPSQKLPVLCLVSRENNTGKSTMANLLRMMLGANVAIVGNADLMSDFNAHWATKSVVICDETKIDKQHVIEKIKSLSTAKKIFMNAKGRGQVELDCFIKFILISNNEDNFISVSDEDIRYWIIKVPKLKTENPTITDLFSNEMPAFLSYLSRRKLVTDHRNRMWFHPELLQTEARRKVIANSMTQVEKELRFYLNELFLDTGVEEIMMTTKAIHKEVFKSSTRYEGYYLNRIIRENIKADTYHVWSVQGVDKEYITEAEAVAVAEQRYPDAKGPMIYGYLKKVGKVIRHSYPKMEETFEGGTRTNVRIEVNDNGRPFVFKRKDFVAEENVAITQKDQWLNNFLDAKPDNSNSELPF